MTSRSWGRWANHVSHPPPPFPTHPQKSRENEVLYMWSDVEVVVTKRTLPTKLAQRTLKILKITPTNLRYSSELWKRYFTSEKVPSVPFSKFFLTHAPWQSFLKLGQSLLGSEAWKSSHVTNLVNFMTNFVTTSFRVVKILIKRVNQSFVKGRHSPLLSFFFWFKSELRTRKKFFSSGQFSSQKNSWSYHESRDLFGFQILFFKTFNVRISLVSLWNFRRLCFIVISE